MNEIMKKLKLDKQNPILILNAPVEYNNVLGGFAGEIHREIKGKYEFIQIFATSLNELNNMAEELTNTLDGDGYLWVCYPKGTSKKYKSDINRDRVRDAFGPYDFESVTLVAVDDDWSAMRVRNVDYIKTMKRKSSVSEKGKERIEGNK